MIHSFGPLHPDIWGPHFWFFMHTLALSYPQKPNEVTIKKYYELFHNMPLFIPIESIGNDFRKLLDEYPITAYLDTRDDLIKWVHFIHNKVNEKMEKPKITMEEFYTHYREVYQSHHQKSQYQRVWKEKLIYVVLITSLIGIGTYVYHQT